MMLRRKRISLINNCLRKTLSWRAPSEAIDDAITAFKSTAAVEAGIHVMSRKVFYLFAQLVVGVLLAASVLLATASFAAAQGTDSRCYDSANEYSVAPSNWTGCAGMLIVSENRLRSAGTSSTDLPADVALGNGT